MSTVTGSAADPGKTKDKSRQMPAFLYAALIDPLRQLRGTLFSLAVAIGQVLLRSEVASIAAQISA